MTDWLETSHSELNTLGKCNRMWYYAYGMGLQPKKARNLVRGIIVHEMIAAYVRGRDPWAEYERAITETFASRYQAYPEEYDGLWDEIYVIMQAYFDWYSNEDIEFDIEMTEKRYVVTLSTRRKIKLVLVIDAIGYTSDGRVWLVEHKTRQSVPEGGIEYYDTQSLMYVEALWRLGIKVDGVIWNYIRWKKPAVPELLKNGTLTKRQNIDTLWPVYRQAIKENGLRLADYKDMKELLAGNENKWFSRKEMSIDPVLARNTWDDARALAVEVRKSMSKRHFPRQQSLLCNSCSFRGICEQQMLGNDISRMLKGYTQRERQRVKV